MMTITEYRKMKNELIVILQEMAESLFEPIKYRFLLESEIK